MKDDQNPKQQKHQEKGFFSTIWQNFKLTNPESQVPWRLLGQNFVDYKDKYPGICNLCYFEGHKTHDCPFSLVFYHATNKTVLQNILNHGLFPNPGRLGEAVYVGDDPELCIKFAYSQISKYEEVILLKVKVMITGKIEVMKKFSLGNLVAQERKLRENIEGIKCPYNQKQGLDEYALFKPVCFIVSWRVIAYGQNQMRDGLRVKQQQDWAKKVDEQQSASEKKKNSTLINKMIFKAFNYVSRGPQKQSQPKK